MLKVDPHPDYPPEEGRYLRGNDLKFQLGVLRGEASETVSGAPAEAKAVGVRSQMQMQF